MSENFIVRSPGAGSVGAGAAAVEGPDVAARTEHIPGENAVLRGGLHAKGYSWAFGTITKSGEREVGAAPMTAMSEPPTIQLEPYAGGRS